MFGTETGIGQSQQEEPGAAAPDPGEEGWGIK
jgi:hypothetical protein